MTRPLIVAHRGAPRGGAAENTIRAFREAAAAGADGVEMDVRGTADGRVVVLHDAEAPAAGGKRVPVRALALEDLRDPGVEAVDRVPPLEEAIRALLGRTGVIVEVKEPGIEERVASILTSMKADTRLPWLLVASFHPEVLRGFSRRAPGIRTALVVAPDGPGFGGWLRGKRPLAAWRSSGAADLMPEQGLVTKALAAAVASGGGRVLPWTVNDPGEAGRLLAAGCAGIVTDRPGDLAAEVRSG